MPYRKVPLISGEVYHVFNRSVAKQTIFNNYYDYDRILELINYYRFKNLPLRYSFYKRLEKDIKKTYEKKYFFDNQPMVSILAFCIMPNHFHFLIQPLTDNAVSDFMRNIQNGYSKYYNLKYKRNGSLFQSMFKAVHIETEEQLIHVCRYIHINPTTSYVIAEKDLEGYRWSSLRFYLTDIDRFSLVEKNTVMEYFSSIVEFKRFIFDQIDYQRTLDEIKHLTWE